MIQLHSKTKDSGRTFHSWILRLSSSQSPALKAIYLPSLPIPTVKPQVDLQVDCSSEVLSSIDGLVTQLLLDSEDLQITIS
jgi:hypothetical protein